MTKEIAPHGVINRRSFIQLVAVAGAAGACWKMGLFGSSSLQSAHRSQPMMGTIINLTVYGPDKEHCEEVLTQTLHTMNGLEARLSRHMSGSELSQLNRNGTLAKPSKDLLYVLRQADMLNKQTQGGFDVTILPLLKLFEETKNSSMPLAVDDYSIARDLIGHDTISIAENRITIQKQGVGISLDGIGKGYIVDQGVASLRNHGFHNVFVEAGGDLMVSGLKNGKTPWRIGLRNPRPGLDKKLVAISVSDRAVATSGDYFQAFSPDLRKHHIIDPRSGFSPPELASVTVTAPSVTLADGLATAVMVLGRQDGLELIESFEGCEAYLVGKDLQQFNSSGFFS